MPRAILILLSLLGAGATLPAQTPAPAPAPTAAKADAPVLLPKLEVKASRLREIDSRIKRLEKQIAREKKQLERTTLDETLNSDKVTKATALFGGKSTAQRVSVAAVRLESLEKELALLDVLRTPLTVVERQLIEKQVEEQRIYRRELDLAYR